MPSEQPTAEQVNALIAAAERCGCDVEDARWVMSGGSFMSGDRALRLARDSACMAVLRWLAACGRGGTVGFLDGRWSVRLYPPRPRGMAVVAVPKPVADVGGGTVEAALTAALNALPERKPHAN